jgi:hypothetical protein
MSYCQNGTVGLALDKLFHANFPRYVGNGSPDSVPYGKTTQWAEERGAYETAPARAAYFSPNGIRLQKPRDNSIQTNVDLKKYEGSFFPTLSPSFGRNGGQPGWQRDSGNQIQADTNGNYVAAFLRLDNFSPEVGHKIPEPSAGQIDEMMRNEYTIMKQAQLDQQFKAMVRYGYDEQTAINAMKKKAEKDALVLLNRFHGQHLNDYLQAGTQMLKQKA